MAVVLLVVTAPIGAAALQLSAQLGRVPNVFDGLDHRPDDGPDPGALDLLVVSVYGAGRSPTTWLPGARRPINVLVVHVDGDGRGAAVVGLPLDATLDAQGAGRQTLASVLDRREPGRLVAAVERLTDVRMDHVAVLDWRAVESLTEAAGGFELLLSPLDVGGSPGTRPYRAYVDGQSAMEFATTRQGVDPVQRLHRQLVLMDEAMRSSLEGEMHRKPTEVYGFLDLLTRNLAVDEGWSSASMARRLLSLWSLRSAEIRYLTPPMQCRGPAGGCRLTPDQRAAREFWSAFGNDGLDQWLEAHDGRGRANVMHPG